MNDVIAINLPPDLGYHREGFLGALYFGLEKAACATKKVIPIDGAAIHAPFLDKVKERKKVFNRIYSLNI